MHLTQHTDFALRVMIYLAVRPGERVTIQEISDTYGISRNHLMKVVQRLGMLGHIKTVRGKRGGLMLRRPPNRVRVGSIVRDMEDNLSIVECFSPGGQCRISGVCHLQGAISNALTAFLRVLDRYTLADLTDNVGELTAALGIPLAPVHGSDSIRGT